MTECSFLGEPSMKLSEKNMNPANEASKISQEISPLTFLPWILKPLDEKPHFLGLFLRRCTRARRGWTGLWLGRRRGSRQRPAGRRRDPLRFLVLPKGEQVRRFRGHYRCRNPDEAKTAEREEKREAADVNKNNQVPCINPSEKTSMAESCVRPACILVYSKK